MVSKTQLKRASEIWYPLPVDAPVDAAGYIDGLKDGEITGWVADVSNPERIITLCICINETLAGKITACEYRADLAGILGSGGLHGFSFRVPDEFFGEKVWSLEVALEDGRYLSPRPLEITDPLSRGQLLRPVRTPCLLFIHVPKTAGTALRSALRQQSGRSRHLLLYPDAPGFRGEYLSYLPESQLRNLECVYGHFGFRMHKYLPQRCEYAAVLREPIVRTLSHLEQVRRCASTGEHPPAALTTEEFLRETRDTAFDNIMTRLISGETGDVLPFGGVNEAVLEHAIDNLHTWFCYAGLQEHIDEVQEQMALRLDLPIRGVEYEHVSAGDQYQAVSSNELAAVRELTEYDRRLYYYVREHLWESGSTGWVHSPNY